MSIEIRGLRKSFDDVEVLKGIDFVFETGKVNMIIGGSGSGKSVMLKYSTPPRARCCTMASYFPGRMKASFASCAAPSASSFKVLPYLTP
jgi:ABC-type hemin transport system ATPase subunit